MALTDVILLAKVTQPQRYNERPPLLANYYSYWSGVPMDGLATLEPPPTEVAQLLGAIAGNQPDMDGFVRMNAGTISPAAFFAPGNVSAMMATADCRR